MDAVTTISRNFDPKTIVETTISRKIFEEISTPNHAETSENVFAVNFTKILKRLEEISTQKCLVDAATFDFTKNWRFLRTCQAKCQKENRKKDLSGLEVPLCEYKEKKNPVWEKKKKLI